MKYLFVGEERSKLARKMNVTWRDGRLAAKQLFDALDAVHIKVKDCEFCNWFEGGDKKAKRWKEGEVVAMGRKVQKAMTEAGIPYIPIVHPAARGKIRRKANYIRHIQERLGEKYSGVLRDHGYGCELAEQRGWSGIEVRLIPVDGWAVDIRVEEGERDGEYLWGEVFDNYDEALANYYKQVTYITKHGDIKYD